MGVRICPKCNGKVSDSRNKCIHCGYVFPSKKVCPDCGEIVDIASKECNVCGYPFFGLDVEDPVVIEGQEESFNVKSKDLKEASIENEKETIFDDNITETSKAENDELESKYNSEKVKELSDDNKPDESEINQKKAKEIFEDIDTEKELEEISFPEKYDSISEKLTNDNSEISVNIEPNSIFESSSDEKGIQDENINETILCPFCGGEHLMEIGINICMCETCKGKFAKTFVDSINSNFETNVDIKPIGVADSYCEQQCENYKNDNETVSNNIIVNNEDEDIVLETSKETINISETEICIPESENLREEVIPEDHETANKDEDCVEFGENDESYTREAENTVAENGTEENTILANAEVGDIITFGKYKQEESINSSKSSIEWIVLKKKQSALGTKFYALVVSKYVLDSVQFNDFYELTSWGNCSLRKWLNTKFLNEAFSIEEQTKIKNEIGDKIFILNGEECFEFFSSFESRKCVPTKYAIKNECEVNRACEKNGERTCAWWLRDSGNNKFCALAVGCDGYINETTGIYVHRTGVGVRPAMWITLDD